MSMANLWMILALLMLAPPMQRVAVMDFENTSHHKAFDWVRTVLAGRMRLQLTELTGVASVERKGFCCPCTTHRSAPGPAADSVSPLSHRSPRPDRNAACKSEPFSMMPHRLARPETRSHLGAAHRALIHSCVSLPPTQPFSNLVARDSLRLASSRLSVHADPKPQTTLIPSVRSAKSR